MMKANQVRNIALAGVLLALATISPVVAFNQSDLERLNSTHNCASCDLSGARLPGLAGSGADLRYANLSGAFLYKAKLSGAWLDGASLRGANLSAANLSGAHGANLTGAFTDKTTVCPSGAVGPCK